MASKEMMPAAVDDLYADVVDLPIPEPADLRAQSLVERVKELEDATKQLKRENTLLKRNIGTLFRTATSELDRKDRQIEELREQVVSKKSRKVDHNGKPKDDREEELKDEGGKVDEEVKVTKQTAKPKGSVKSSETMG